VTGCAFDNLKASTMTMTAYMAGDYARPLKQKRFCHWQTDVTPMRPTIPLFYRKWAVRIR
jgi:hypothetical protein